MVDCLSPHLLGAQTLEPYTFVAGHTAALGNTIITNPEPVVVVVVVDSLQPLLRGGPPPLPHSIAHHVHIVQGAMPHELGGYTSVVDAHTSIDV